MTAPKITLEDVAQILGITTWVSVAPNESIEGAIYAKHGASVYRRLDVNQPDAAPLVRAAARIVEKARHMHNCDPYIPATGVTLHCSMCEALAAFDAVSRGEQTND